MRYLFNSDNYDLTDPGSIPNLLVQHLYFVGVAMLVSLVIAIPLGILVTRYRSLYLPVLGIADLLYSIPGIALIAILIPIPAIGIGPLAIIIPLVLYTQVALIRNTAAAINGIDPLLLEVGRAVGMNGWQVLTRVTLPLALPVIIAGVRIATLTTIGIATLAALISQGGLGTLIFKNIGRDDQAVIAGAILLSVLAIVIDLLLLTLQTLLNRGRSTVTAA